MNPIMEELLHLLQQFGKNWRDRSSDDDEDQKEQEVSIFIEKTKNIIWKKNITPQDNNLIPYDEGEYNKTTYDEGEYNKTTIRGYCLIQHYLAFNDTLIELVRFLLNRNENLIFDRIMYGDRPIKYGYHTILPHLSLPLHSILYHGENASVDVIRLLLMHDREKETMFMKDEYGCLPLHVACKYGASIDVMKLLLEHVPSATTRNNNNNKFLPLYNPSPGSLNSHQSKRRKRYNNISSCLSKKDCHGNTPLHYLYGENASVDVIRLLLMYDEEKKTLLEKDAYGRLPFHVACMRGASVEMMKLALVDDIDDDDGRKACIFGKDRFGNTPLHYLCCYHEEWVPCERIFSFSTFKSHQCTISSKERNRGNNARIVEQIEFLFDHDNNNDANKSLLFIKNDEGRLPLHVACENNASIEVIKLLLLKCDKLGQKYSMMLLEKDRHDNIPLHYACCCTQSDDDCRQNNNSLEVIKILLEHDDNDDGEEKKSLLEKGNRKRLPIDYAREKRASSDVMRFLLQWHIWVSNNKVFVPIKIPFYRSKIDTFLRTCITKYQYREDTLESYDEKVKKFVSYCSLIEATTLLELVLQKKEFSHGIEVIMNRTMDFLVVKKEK